MNKYTLNIVRQLILLGISHVKIIRELSNGALVLLLSLEDMAKIRTKVKDGRLNLGGIVYRYSEGGLRYVQLEKED